jgi:ABC-type transport system involved in multi-copper enzyme maturation permease subunit
MTASIVSSVRSSSRPGAGRFDGLGALVRKDLAEWRSSPRVWVILGVATVFMVLAMANAWLNALIIANLPPGAEAPSAPTSMAPLDNIGFAVGSQIFVIAAVFATLSLLVGDRDRGTLAWVASKPVGRGAIWVSKWIAASISVTLAAGLVPFAVVVVGAAVLYGPPAVVPIMSIAFGIAAAIVLYVAVTLAASTVLWNQAAVAATGLAVLVVPGLLVGLLPVAIEPYLPTSILGWSMGLAIGADVGFVTPIAWAVGVIALAGFAIRRLERIEL